MIEHKGLNEIVAYVNELEAAGESVSDETYYAREVATKLLSGKVDQACELREAVGARIDALQLALEQAKALKSKIDACFEQALQQVEGKKLSGLAWAIRLQNNSKGSVIIENEEAIPVELRRVEVSLSEKFPATDEESLCFWASVVLKTPVESSASLSEEQKSLLAGYVSVVPNKSEIEARLKKDADSVPGAKLHKGQHVRVVKGGALTAQKSVE